MTDTCTLISYTRAFPAVSFLHFLEAMPIAPRIYWESAQTTIEFAGGGAAAELYASGADRFEQIRDQWSALFAEMVIDSTAPEHVIPRIFGGFAFRDDFMPSDVWTAFPAAYFVLPRYQITRTRNETGTVPETWLTINRQLMPFEHADSALDSLEWEFESVLRRVMVYVESADTTRSPVQVESFDYPLTHERWNEIIAEATASMKSHDYEKVVLSRTADLRLSAPANLLAALERMGEKYPHTFRFLIEPGAGRAFFGASPELLARVSGDVLETAALAGSRKRGATPADDRAMVDDLLTNTKDRAEHQFVVSFLAERLAPLTSDIAHRDQPSVMTLPNIHHLYTPVSACLKPGIDALSTVRALHPTPAMGGYPQEIGFEEVARLEPVTRGWYAAPIGWIDARGDAMFAVAIRSAVSSGKRVRLYAGAGIVADSDADREWDEIELKFRPMMDALGVNLYERAES